MQPVTNNIGGYAVKALLALIPPVILALILWKGGRYDSAWFTPPGTGRDGGLLLPDTLAGWSLADAQWFPENRMFEKINGRASLYQQFGVEGLLAGVWNNNGKSWDMYWYVMNDARAASGVFAAERPAANTRIEIGDSAYITPGALAVQAHRHYLQIVAHAAGENALSVTGLAGPISAHLLRGKETSPQVETAERVLLTTGFHLPGTEGHLAEQAFGYASLADVEYITCIVNTSTATWFTATGGLGALAGYTNELMRYGIRGLFMEEGAIGGDMHGKWELIGVVGEMLLGVRDADTKEAMLSHWRVFSSRGR